MEPLDFKTLDCPQPVIQTKQYLDENPDIDQIIVLVDNKAASENVMRFLNTSGYDVRIEKAPGNDSGFRILGTKNKTIADVAEQPAIAPIKNDRSTLVMIANNTIGNGTPELGQKLMQNFLKTLPEIGSDLWRLVFVNEGVKLTIASSESLSVLKELEKSGISILVCGTCLEFYNLLEEKVVGVTTNMLDIVTSLQTTEKVIQF